MKHLGLFAFGVTTCVLVPTALQLLQAGPKQVAKLVAPGSRTIAVGKAKIDVGLDRAFVDAGDKIHVTLTGTAETHQRVTLAVLVLESTGTSGGRVETPPARISRDEITLDIVNGTATKQVAFTLPGARPQNMDGFEPFGHYTILVMPPKDADQLEKLRRRAQGSRNPMDDEGGKIRDFNTAYNSTDREPSADDDGTPAVLGTPGQVARLEVNTRSKSSTLSILAPETGRAGEELAVTVRIANPTKQPIANLLLKLGSKPYAVANDYLGIDEDHVSITEGDRTVSLKPKETVDVVFHVTATTTGVLGLVARLRCDGDCYQDGQVNIDDAVLDAVEIAPAERPPTVVGDL